MPSRLLDMRECADPAFRDIYAAMRALDLARQPAWFRPLLLRSRRLRGMTGFDHWSRAWEYPWAVIEAGLAPPATAPATGDGTDPVATGPLRLLDVGGGGSPFGPWLARRGHEVHVADPSLDQGRDYAWDPARGVYRNARTVAKRAAFRLLGVRSLWGLPGEARGDARAGGAAAAAGPIYHPFGAQALGFPDAHFDRVFCLSVIEHVPHDLWPACVREFERVLRPGGRLVITMDMETHEANARLPMRLVEACSLRLVGDPRYPVPIDPDEAQRRHPGNWYETFGLAWTK